MCNTLQWSLKHLGAWKAGLLDPFEALRQVLCDIQDASAHKGQIPSTLWGAHAWQSTTKGSHFLECVHRKNGCQL